jgi:uncharacterized protein (DUF983 family)
MNERPDDTAVPGTLLRRAFLLRCPNCGAGRLFRRWVYLRSACPSCGLLFDRGERDYFIGAYLINFIGAEVMIALVAGCVVLLTWPEVPWQAIKWGLVALMVPFPILTYPWSKMLWLAIDLSFRPITLNDIAGHGENIE